jgi:hypothetical protein
MILRITDSTTTCDLVWHSVANRKFIQARDGWAPQIAGRRRSQLGGRGPYTDVTEEITIHVCGQTAQEAMSNLATLNQLIEQAEEWARELRTAPTFVQYSPTGGDVWQAVILGRAPGDESGALQLAPTFDARLNTFIIENVRLRFARMGLWLGVTDTAQSAAAANPSTLIAQLPAISAAKGLTPGVRSPVKISFDAQTTGTNTCRVNGGGFAIVTDRVGGIRIISAESASLGGTYSSVADAAAQALNGSVLRYTPAAALGNNFTFWSVSNFGHKFDIFMAVRNNSGISFSLTPWVQIVGTSTLSRDYFAPPIVIDNANTIPRIVYAGSFSLPVGIDGFTLGMFLSALSTPGGSTLDIDYIVLVLRENENVTIVNVNQESTQLRMLTNQGLTLDHQLLGSPQPAVRITTTSTGVTIFDLDYRGDPLVQSLVSLNLSTLTGLLMVTSGEIYWCAVDFTTAPAFSAVTQFKLTATRMHGTLVPQ